MTRVAAAEIRDNFSEIGERAGFKGERIVVTRHGRDFVALVSVEDLRLLEMLEDRVDLAMAREALSAPGNGELIDWEDVKEQLGL